MSWEVLQNNDNGLKPYREFVLTYTNLGEEYKLWLLLFRDTGEIQLGQQCSEELKCWYKGNVKETIGGHS